VAQALLIWVGIIRMGIPFIKKIVCSESYVEKNNKWKLNTKIRRE
jgi:hypothetical protein